MDEEIEIIGCIKVADVPDIYGNIVTLEALQEIAKADPEHYWMDGKKLMLKRKVRTDFEKDSFLKSFSWVPKKDV